MEDIILEIIELKKRVKKIYIYGTGMYGRNLFHIIDKRNIKIDGFIETNPEKNQLLVYQYIVLMKSLMNNAE